MVICFKGVLQYLGIKNTTWHLQSAVPFTGESQNLLERLSGSVPGPYSSKMDWIVPLFKVYALWGRCCLFGLCLHSLLVASRVLPVF